MKNLELTDAQKTDLDRFLAKYADMVCVETSRVRCTSMLNEPHKANCFSGALKFFPEIDQKNSHFCPKSDPSEKNLRITQKRFFLL